MLSLCSFKGTNHIDCGIISALSCYRHCISNDFFEGVHYDETGPGYFTWVGGYDINYHITKKNEYLPFHKKDLKKLSYLIIKVTTIIVDKLIRLLKS